MRKLFFLYLILQLSSYLGNAQTINCSNSTCPLVNNLIINTGYNPITQTNIATGQKDINWIVTGMSSEMQKAICNGNTNGPQAPSNSPLLSPVLLNQPADVISTGSISCFSGNTIYTLLPPAQPAGGNFNYSMNISKQFFVCSNKNESVTFVFSALCDDAIDSILIDKNGPNTVPLLLVMTKTVGSGTPINVNKTVILTPGLHTLDIQCANWEDPSAVNNYPLTINGISNQYTWNPFRAEIIGTITSANNVLVNNAVCCIASASKLDTTICLGETYRGHSLSGTYIDTIKNVAGCDSIRTLNLTVKNCQSICKSSFDFSRSLNSIVNLTANTPATLSQLYSSTGFTWEGWVKLKAPITNQSLIISEEDAKPFQDIFLGFGWGATPKALSFSVADNGTTNTTVAVESVQNLTVGTWYHIAAACDYNNSQLLLFVNGSLVGTKTIPASILSNRLNSNHQVQIGNANAAANGIDADIDEVRFWSSARTQTQIQSSMNQCLSFPQAGLSAYFKADEKTGNIAYSAADNNFIGSLVNTSWAEQVPAINCKIVDITYDSTSCNSFNFRGLSYVNAGTIISWKWYFDDGTTSNSQDTAHIFTTDGKHTTTLVVADENGCTDSAKVTVTSSTITVDAGKDSTVCKGIAAPLHGSGTNVVQYAWSPKIYLNDSSLQTPLATPPGTTKFYVTATNAFGCVKKDSVIISVQKVSIVSNNDTSICAGTNVQLNATGAATYNWLPINSVSDPAIANPVTTPLITTQYVVFGKSTLGCIGIDTLNITVNSLPVVETINDSSICKGSSIQLNTTGAQTYSWSPVAYLSSSTSSSPVASPVNSSQYIVTGKSIDGCTAKDTVNISILQPPVITKTNDTSICKNASVQLFAAGGVSYLWTSSGTINNASSATPTVSPSSAFTVFYVAVADANTCTNIDSVKVSIKQVPAFYVSPDQSVCTTEPVQLNAGGGDSYLWSPSSLVSNSTINNPLTNTNSSTTYSVLIKESACNNSITLTTTVNLLPPLNITVTKSNDLDCSNGSANLVASGANWYQWSPVAGLSDTSIADPVASSSSTIKYTVKGSNHNGCVGYDTITVYANYSDNAAGYYMPNAFTPNGDGINDCFGIRYWGLIEKLDFTIFDRWGNIVFYTNDPGACWNGIYKGQPAAAANYVYIIKAITACGSVERKGNLILIR